MFEGTDLSMAYGFSEPVMQQQSPVYSPQLPPPPAVQSNTMQPPQQIAQPAPKQMVSVQQPNELPYQPPEDMYAQQRAPVYQEDTFLQKVANRRYDVLKVVVFAMIILFAISMDRLLTHYLTQYITDSILSKGQEFLIRLSYPVAILLIIWFIKAM